MAIDDNASYELTGYQVKDLASKIRAKADSSALASVATSGLYSDLTGAPTIPTVYNGTLTIQQNGTQLGTFSANQSSNTTINITGGGGSAITFFYADPTQTGSTRSLYKDDALTIAATMQDILDASEDGVVIMRTDSSDQYTQAYTDASLQNVYFLESDDYTVMFLSERKAYHFNSSYPAATTFSYWETEYQQKLTAGTNVTITGDTISATDTTYSAMTGATSQVAGTSGLVPAPAAGDQDKVLKGDGTWGEKSDKFVIMKYGESNSWAKFIAAYQSNAIVYCRASSNANPATGAQTRLAFMAYVNNETSPTSVEFQYVRSVGTKTSSQPVDQVFVYKLTNASGGTWTVETRDMAPKLAAGTNTSVSYSSGTYTVNATDTTYSNMTGATSGTAGAAGLVPAPAAGDQDKFLKGDGTWGTVSSPMICYVSPYVWGGYTTGQFFEEDSLTTAIAPSDIFDAFYAGTPVFLTVGYGQEPSDGSEEYYQILSIYKAAAKFSLKAYTMIVKNNSGTTLQIVVNTTVTPYTISVSRQGYSTSEVDTGTTWINGETIYKKTINFGALPNATLKNVVHGISNLGLVVKIESIAYSSSNYTTLPLVYNSNDASYNSELGVDSTNVFVNTTQDRSSFSAYVTLYYTKSS